MRAPPSSASYRDEPPSHTGPATITVVGCRPPSWPEAREPEAEQPTRLGIAPADELEIGDGRLLDRAGVDPDDSAALDGATPRNAAPLPAPTGGSEVKT